LRTMNFIAQRCFWWRERCNVRTRALQERYRAIRTRSNLTCIDTCVLMVSDATIRQRVLRTPHGFKHVSVWIRTLPPCRLRHVQRRPRLHPVWVQPYPVLAFTAMNFKWVEPDESYNITWTDS
jgi:hypothetical protein